MLYENDIFSGLVAAREAHNCQLLVCDWLECSSRDLDLVDGKKCRIELINSVMQISCSKYIWEMRVRRVLVGTN